MQGRIMRRLVAATAALLLVSAPAALADTVVDGPQGTTTDATPTFTFTGEAGSTFECKIDPPGQWKPCASPYSASLADGSYTFSVRATDAAGNVETTPPTRAFTVDTSAIDTTLEAGPEGLSNDATPSFTFSSPVTGATFECKIEGAGSSIPAFADCSAPFTAPKLQSGAYTFKVRAKKGALTDSTPAERSFTVDATAPDTTITDGPAEGSKTTNRTPTFTSASSEAGSTFECRVDNTAKEGVDTVAWGDCPAAYKLAELDGGQHTLEVRATDQAGNTDATPAKRTFTILVCDTEVRFGLIEALGECLANVGTSSAPVWESTQPIKVNGLPLPVVGGSKIILTGPTPERKGGSLAVEDIKLVIAGIQVYKGGFSWDLPEGGAGRGEGVQEDRPLRGRPEAVRHEGGGLRRPAPAPAGQRGRRLQVGLPAAHRAAGGLQVRA